MNKYIYFSATNTTKRVMEALGAERANSININLSSPAANELCFSENDLIYIGFPVFGGRVPALVLERLDALAGNNCRSIIVAVYGGRHYDDALKEMQAFCERKGCRVVCAVAAVAQHSIAPTIAAGRPDANDLRHLHKIKEEVEDRLSQGKLQALEKRPEETYMEYRPLPIHPESTDSCTLCSACEKQCPVGAITVAERCITDAERCIICMRCVAICPEHSRSLPPKVLQDVTERIRSRAGSERKEITVLWG